MYSLKCYWADYNGKKIKTKLNEYPETVQFQVLSLIEKKVELIEIGNLSVEVKFIQ